MRNEITRAPFAPEILESVFDLVKASGEGGFNVNDFETPAQALAAGFLTAKGMLEPIGGGSEPYILRAVSRIE